MTDIEKRFLQLAIGLEALLFGEFTLKSGRESLYFFNIAKFLESGHLGELAEMYSEKITECKVDYDVIFGPSYKGIPLAAAVATVLNQKASKKSPFVLIEKKKKIMVKVALWLGQ